MSNTLTPPDLAQCQAEIREGSFMTLGPRSMIRCTNKPSVIIEEKEPNPKDGLRGSMSLCPDCLEQAKRQLGDSFDIRPIDD